jgi:hypothetical protein
VVQCLLRASRSVRWGVGHSAGLDEGAQLVVGERLDERWFDAECLDSGNRSAWSSPPAVSQDAKRRTAC